MRKIVRKSFAAFLSVLTACAVWFGIKCMQMYSAEMEMDQREIAYDVDGGFIMIDTMRSHMGVYDTAYPLRHIWKEGLRRIAPGAYSLTICDGWLELYGDDLHSVYVIYLGEDETAFFSLNIEQDTPILVY